MNLQEGIIKLGFNVEANPTILMDVKCDNHGDTNGQGQGEGLVIACIKCTWTKTKKYAVLVKRDGGVHLNICNQSGYSTCAVVIEDLQGVDLSMLEPLVNHK